MAIAQFIHDGGTIDYTPPSDVTAGDVVVQGELVGVAKLHIKAGKLGALAVVGVFDFAKATGVGSGLAAGALAYWDAATQQATSTSAGNKLLGKVVRAAGDDDAVVRIRLSQ